MKFKIEKHEAKFEDIKKQLQELKKEMYKDIQEEYIEKNVDPQFMPKISFDVWKDDFRITFDYNNENKRVVVIDGVLEERILN